MLVKLLAAAMLLAILISLGTGFFYLMRDKGQSDRTVKALTVRIALSVTLFILFLIAAATGLITPHGPFPQ